MTSIVRQIKKSSISNTFTGKCCDDLAIFILKIVDNDVKNNSPTAFSSSSSLFIHYQDPHDVFCTCLSGCSQTNSMNSARTTSD